MGREHVPFDRCEEFGRSLVKLVALVVIIGSNPRDATQRRSWFFHYVRQVCLLAHVQIASLSGRAGEDEES
jgi:hypothetical protein